MEARNQSDLTKSLVASVAIHRAKVEKLSICKSMAKYKNYQWYWEKQRVPLRKYELKAVEPIASKELKQPTLVGRYFFNTVKLGKRFKTKFKPKRSGCMLFY